MKIKQISYVKLEPKSRDPYLRRTDGEMIKIVMHWVVEPGKFEVLIGSSTEDIKLKNEFIID